MTFGDIRGDPVRHLEPSLDGSPLEVCLALLSEDMAPGDAARYVILCMNYQDSETFDLLTEAGCLFVGASCLRGLEEVGTSLRLIHTAKSP